MGVTRHHLRVALVLVAGVCLLALAWGTQEVARGLLRWDEGPLASGDHESWGRSMGDIAVGEPAAFSLPLENRTGDRMVLDAVRLVGLTDGARLVFLGIVGPGRSRNWGGYHSWPLPPSEPVTTTVRGTVFPEIGPVPGDPASSLMPMAVLQLDDPSRGEGFSGWEVDYHVGWRRYRMHVAFAGGLCTETVRGQFVEECARQVQPLRWADTTGGPATWLLVVPGLLPAPAAWVVLTVNGHVVLPTLLLLGGLAAVILIALAARRSRRAVTPT